MNYGTCADGVNKYTCKCATGYMGVNCESMSDQHSIVCDTNTLSNHINRIGVITLYDVVIKLYFRKRSSNGNCYLKDGLKIVK